MSAVVVVCANATTWIFKLFVKEQFESWPANTRKLNSPFRVTDAHLRWSLIEYASRVPPLSHPPPSTQTYIYKSTAKHTECTILIWTPKTMRIWMSNKHKPILSFSLSHHGYPGKWKRCRDKHEPRTTRNLHHQQQQPPATADKLNETACAVRRLLNDATNNWIASINRRRFRELWLGCQRGAATHTISGFVLLIP